MHRGDEAKQRNRNRLITEQMLLEVLRFLQLQFDAILLLVAVESKNIVDTYMNESTVVVYDWRAAGG